MVGPLFALAFFLVLQGLFIYLSVIAECAALWASKCRAYVCCRADY